MVGVEKNYALYYQYTSHTHRRRLHTRGHGQWKNRKQETDKTVMTVTKALTKTAHCTCRAKKAKKSGRARRMWPTLSNSFPRVCTYFLLLRRLLMCEIYTYVSYTLNILHVV